MPDLSQGREAVLLAIVDRWALASGKASFNAAGVIYNSLCTREWFLEAFTLARECIDGPPKQPTGPVLVPSMAR